MGASAAAPGPPQVSLYFLLRPRFLAMRNRWRRSGPSGKLAVLFFSGLTLGFWLSVLTLCVLFVERFSEVELFGPLLLRKALSMLLLSFSLMLLFSNVITALSSYFLSEDMQLIQSLPLSPRRVYYLRFVDTVASSSWMIVIFGLPVLLAYGVVYEGGPLYYLVASLGLLLYLLPPAALGVVIACLLVRGFSARRIREVMTAVSAIFLIILLFGLRMLRPETLVDPHAYETLAEFLAVVRAPDASWLPSTWLAQLCLWSLGQPVEDPTLPAVLLVLACPAFVVTARWVTAPLYFEAWTQAQEGPRRFAKISLWSARLVDTLTAPAPPVLRALLRKDLRVFLREPGQWTQALLLLGLVAIYLYSVYVLPLHVVPLRQGLLENAIAFLNVGVAGAVLAAIAVRFQFTAVSQEGRAFWILHSSPIGASRFLWGKVLVGFIPTLALGEVLVLSTNTLLNVDPLYGWIAGGTVACLAFGLSGMAVGMGAIYPEFRADSAARMAAGPGAILFMVLALSFVGLIIAVEAVPVGLYLAKGYQGQEPSAGLQAALIASIGFALVANVAAAVLALHLGATQLWSGTEGSGRTDKASGSSAPTS